MVWQYKIKSPESRAISDVYGTKGNARFSIWYDLTNQPKEVQDIQTNPAFPFEYLDPSFILRFSDFYAELDKTGLSRKMWSARPVQLLVAKQPRQVLHNHGIELGERATVFPMQEISQPAYFEDYLEMLNYATKRFPFIEREATPDHIDWKAVQHRVSQDFYDSFDSATTALRPCQARALMDLAKQLQI